METREESVQTMPALAMETVCCSMASNKTCFSPPILSNSSMQHSPPSLSTNAPASKHESPVIYVSIQSNIDFVFRHGDGQSASGRRVSTHKHAARTQRGRCTEQLALSKAWIAHHQYMDVSSTVLHRHASCETQQNARFDEFLSVDGRTHRVD